MRGDEGLGCRSPRVAGVWLRSRAGTLPVVAFRGLPYEIRAKRLHPWARTGIFVPMFASTGTVPPQTAVTQLRDAVDLLQGLDLTASTDDEVLGLLRELETQKRRLPTVEHAAIAEVDSRHLAHQRGCRSTAALLRQLLRLDPGEACGRVRAAAELGPRRTLTGQPLPAVFAATAAACAAGQISQRHAAVITHTVTTLPAAVQVTSDLAVEAILLGHAHDLDPRLLKIAARDLAAALDPDGLLTDEGDRRRQLSCRQRPDGTVHGSFELDPIAGEALLTALDTLAQPQPQPELDGVKDPRSGATTRCANYCCTPYAPANCRTAAGSAPPSS